MRPRKEETGLGFDWVTSGRRSAVRLSADSPLWVRAGRYEGPLQDQVHIHPGIEVGVMLSGRAERQFSGHVIPGVPGDVWLCAVWEPHALRIVDPESSRVVMIFLPEFLGDEMLGNLPWLSLFAAPPNQRPRVGTAQMRRTILATGRRLESTVLDKSPGWQSSVRIDLLRLLFDLSRGWRPPLAPPPNPPRSDHLSRIIPALTLLHEREAHGLSLQEAAQACNLGQTQFALLFRQTMGLSFGRFRRRAHLALAAHLLLTTDRCLDDVAFRLGFTDAPHLHRSFLSQYGCTPGQYRQRHR